MENIIVKQQLLTNFFTYHPQGGALYDSNGQLVALNKAISEKLAVTEMSDFLFTNLFETNYLSEVQKRYLRNGSVVSHTLPIGFSIIPGINANNEIIGYTLLLTDLDPTEQEKENQILAGKLIESRTMMELALKNSHIATYSFNFHLFQNL